MRDAAGEGGNRGCQANTGDREGARGVKDRIHPRLVPVLFALIAPRYNSILPGDPPPSHPQHGRYVRSNKRRSVRASIISIWRASMRRKRETGRAWQLLNGSVDVVKVPRLSARRIYTTSADVSELSPLRPLNNVTLTVTFKLKHKEINICLLFHLLASSIHYFILTKFEQSLSQVYLVYLNRIFLYTLVALRNIQIIFLLQKIEKRRCSLIE